jgi:hypothetical protein
LNPSRLPASLTPLPCEQSRREADSRNAAKRKQDEHHRRDQKIRLANSSTEDETTQRRDVSHI